MRWFALFWLFCLVFVTVKAYSYLDSDLSNGEWNNLELSGYSDVRQNQFRHPIKKYVEWNKFITSIWTFFTTLNSIKKHEKIIKKFPIIFKRSSRRHLLKLNFLFSPSSSTTTPSLFVEVLYRIFKDILKMKKKNFICLFMSSHIVLLDLLPTWHIVEMAKMIKMKLHDVLRARIMETNRNKMNCRTTSIATWTTIEIICLRFPFSIFLQLPSRASLSWWWNFLLFHDSFDTSDN